MDFPKSKVPITSSDVISGSLYLKLIEDFKKYDNDRKNYIKSLLDQIENLKRQIESKEQEIKVWTMCDALEPQAVSKLQFKLYKRRLCIKQLRDKIKILNKQNVDQKNEIIKLKIFINTNNITVKDSVGNNNSQPNGN